MKIVMSKTQLTTSTLVVMLMVRCMTMTYAQPKVVGYVSNSQFTPIDYGKITHLNLAFENPDSLGNLSYSNFNNDYIQQAHLKGKKISVSIAGGFASEDSTFKARYFQLINDANRASFVSKILDYLVLHNLDGLDVDLEGSSINEDYGKFIVALSSALKLKGKLLTAALSHVNGGTNITTETILLFDFINIMAYDATGPWRPSKPGPHSTMDFAKVSLDYWLSRGLPKSKAVLGVPFYGYGFGHDFNQGIAYSEIVDKYKGAENFDIIGDTIYYNGILTLKAKTEFVVKENYGGIMIWNLAQDKDTSDTKSLLRAIDEVIRKGK